MLTGCIKPLLMNNDDMEECIGVLMAARPLVDKWAIYFFGDRKIKKFRHKYTNEYLEEIPVDDRNLIDNLFTVVDQLMSSTVLALGNLAFKFVNRRHRPTMDYDDYFQEACSAVADAVWSYNGSTKFITYALTAARNRLVDLIRQADRTLEPMNESVIESSDDSLTLEELAVDWESVDSEHDFDTDTLWRAIREAPLSEFERDLFMAYLADEPGFQTAVAERHGYTRANASLKWKSAREKVRDTYYNLSGEKLVAA